MGVATQAGQWHRRASKFYTLGKRAMLGRSGSVAQVLFNAIALCHECSLKDDTALLVPLAILSSKLVDPAKFGVAVLAGHVAHHVAAGQHHTILHLTEIEVDHFVEEEGPSRGAREPRADELAAISQMGVAASAREEPGASDVLEKDAPHVVLQVKQRTVQKQTWLA